MNEGDIRKRPKEEEMNRIKGMQKMADRLNVFKQFEFRNTARVV